MDVSSILSSLVVLLEYLTELFNDFDTSSLSTFLSSVDTISDLFANVDISAITEILTNLLTTLSSLT